eukprot:480362-Pyramimonas_sp.AAC.1
MERELFDGRPIEDQARSLAPKLQQARARESSMRKAVEEQRAQIQQLQDHLALAEEKLSAATSEAVRLEEETRMATSQARPPDASKPPSHPRDASWLRGVCRAAGSGGWRSGLGC